MSKDKNPAPQTHVAGSVEIRDIAVRAFNEAIDADGYETSYDIIEKAIRAAIETPERLMNVNDHGSNGETLEKSCTFDPKNDPKNENIQAPSQQLRADCPECHGTGEVFGHADDCHDDLCALNGDIHSCSGKVEPCGCTAPPQPHVVGSRAADLVTALKLAIDHIEHMAAFIGSLNAGYSFESLGEDLPGMKAAVGSLADAWSLGHDYPTDPCPYPADSALAREWERGAWDSKTTGCHQLHEPLRG